MRKREIEAILKKVNAVRKDLGYTEISEIPKGVKNSSLHCPLARALSNGTGTVVVAGSYVRAEGKSKTTISKVLARHFPGRPSWGLESKFSVPAYFRKFVERFDEGKEPAYQNGK